MTNPNDQAAVLDTLEPALPQIHQALVRAVQRMRQVLAADPDVEPLARSTHLQCLVVREMRRAFPEQNDTNYAAYLLVVGDLRLRFNKLGTRGIPYYNSTDQAECMAQGFLFPQAASEGGDIAILQIGWMLDSGLDQMPVFKILRVEDGEKVWDIPLTAAIMALRKRETARTAGIQYNTGPKIEGIEGEASGG